MAFREYDFQNRAVIKLYESYITRKYGSSPKNSTILQAPTGSGKTAILIKLMDYIIQNDNSSNIAFVWLTPGSGELEEQSWSKTSNNSLLVRPVFLMESLFNGFLPGTVTFLNWEMVNNKKNIALRDGERTNLFEAVKSSKERGITFILIIDEEHRNQTTKAQYVIDIFDADMIFKASATPLEDSLANHVLITEDEVISTGLITRSVVLNDQFNGAGNELELHSSDEDFLDVADEKRIKIKSAFKSLKKNINPLVLIQFPDEKKSNEEVETKVKKVKSYLIHELGQKESEVAIWLSGVHNNVQNISMNNSKVNYLLMKQAVSTGWDAPRAKILVKLRLNSSHNFTIQSIGRIRRMPEGHYYDNDLLDSSFVYSNDSEYVYEIIKQGAGSGVSQMGLQKGVSTNIFNLDSRKLKKHLFKDVEAVTHALHQEFKKEFYLTDDVNHNMEQLKKYHWKFGREIYSTIRTGEVSRIEDLATKTKELKTAIPILNTRDWGYRYDSVMELIKPYLHVGDDLHNIRAIINDLFSMGEPGSDVAPILQLRPKDRYSFVINNAPLLRDIVRRMDSNYSTSFNEQLSLTDDNVIYVPFYLPNRDGYKDNGEQGELLNKNVYSGYSTSNWVKQSIPEIETEKQLNSCKNIKWYYRSKDHGYKYFSISYDQDTREFFPDYLVIDTSGRKYILETKGAEGQNIDPYAQSKFNALKNYTNNHCNKNVDFAFIRPSLQHKGVLMFNNTEWSENVDTSPNWKPISELFMNHTQLK
ncbi:Type III restriction-modification system StyLTI enzyme res [Lactiplantibacillus plantarum]|uniref:DEAD/DEAH box helicase n=1 Tax=Lactiplantibacillus plantarum TaxID=1590 RepID=UPI000B3CFD6D|nr:DEAD/DEAH box helicase family protein [Lactiplantibacillus plantarum]OUT03286.1 Type III restriction-modification system StyLTI enzyme res [Lactiplantibacillus plantarum]